VTQLDAHGISVTVPAGWEGRVFRRPSSGEVASAADGPPAPRGETARAVVHVSTIPLPADTGDFASSAVELLGRDDALIVLFEYDPASANEPLFAARGMPRSLRADDFSPNVLQRAIRGQAGVQRFFQESGRAFCLYVVLGSLANRNRLAAGVNQVLSTFELEIAASIAQPPTMAPAALLDLVAQQGDLTTFTELLRHGPVHDLLAREGPFTLFAPDDDAFATVDLASLRADVDWLDRTLRHHVVAEGLSAAALGSRASVTPVEGDALSVTSTRTGQVLVGGVPIVRPDVEAGNGVLHVVTAVLQVPR
jgi:uncharacterized surface protein with fasciclin (FAS1) repeats